ncbi:MAG: hypothetical protein Q7W45_16620 [Bacteroidota bacterium]|nr:hypothetical protein [Bacteroidota bacterium]MDP3145359.1 hypothetical protein [Bacteroidota bacterium]HQW94610.1 hypothetical protein [Saprospiraceae bacterium]
MGKNKNSYQKAALKKTLSGTADASTGAKVKDAATELGKDLVVGVIGGGIAGAVLGRLSFVVGAAVTGVGHYAKSRIASALGLGMMASGTYQAMSGMNGKPTSGLAGVKERLLALKDDMKKRIFLDKVLKAKEKKEEKTDEGTNGLGQVQYFVHPNSEESMGEVEMNALDTIQKQIQESGMKYNQVNGIEVDLLSGEEEMGEVDPSEKNY